MREKDDESRKQGLQTLTRRQKTEMPMDLENRGPERVQGTTACRSMKGVSRPPEGELRYMLGKGPNTRSFLS